MRSVLEAELLKWQRTPVFWVTVAATLAVPFLVVLQLSQLAGPPEWEMVFGNIQIFFVILIGPLVVTLIGAQTIAVEYQSDTWKLMLTTPTDRWKVYVGKWLVGCAWILGLTIVIAIASLPAGLVLDAAGELDLGRRAMAFAVAGIGLTTMLPAFQLITLIFRSFFVTSGVGIVGTFVGAIVLNSEELAGYYPTSAVIVLVMRDSQQLQVNWQTATSVSIAILAALALGSLLVGLFRFRRVDIH